MMNQTQILEEKLKTTWLSNRDANDLLLSAHGDRRLRDIRANLPTGYKMVVKVEKFKPSNLRRTIIYNKYKLVQK